ncbi:hypothetical protein CR165_20135 [Pseudoroseomonas aestuarii]|uniref:Cytochrome C n=2 Tax=Teichococcus aestuarii TaxID=568898 RepID=A0A2U1UZH2_9PROT|nr:hypothetical protein CR165_20135 [Pseudoroseomonas aestuarii]
MVAGLLVLVVLVLGGQKAGWWAQPETRAPYPPTPAALAFAEMQRAEQARAAAAEAENARLAAVQTPAETEEVLPAGHGRAETFANCTACHSTAIIRRSGLTRERWDALMDWMVEKQNMTPLEPDMRVLIVDYLASAFPARQSNPRARNPFLSN